MKERVKDLTIAAHNYIKSGAVAPENMQLAYGDFVNGAKWAFEYMEKNRLTADWNRTGISQYWPCRRGYRVFLCGDEFIDKECSQVNEDGLPLLPEECLG